MADGKSSIKETAASELASCIITVEGFRGKHRVAKQSFTFTAKGGLTQVMTQGVFNAEFAKVTKLKFSTTGVGKIVSPASIFDNFEYEVFYPSKQLQRRADPDTYDATYDDLDLVPGAQLTNVGTYDDLTYRKFGAEPHGVDGVVVSVRTSTDGRLDSHIVQDTLASYIAYQASGALLTLCIAIGRRTSHHAEHNIVLQTERWPFRNLCQGLSRVVHTEERLLRLRSGVRAYFRFTARMHVHR